MITVFIVDDHPIVAHGLEKILSGHPQILLGNIYRDASSLLKGLEKDQPDVLIMDIQLPDTNGIELARIIRANHGDIKILVLTNSDQVFTVRRIFAEGVKGYLLKGTDKFTLIDAIKTVHSGHQYLDPMLKEEVLINFLQKDNTQIFLTQREQSVLDLIAEELTTKEIADQLNIATKSVESCKTDLFMKLSVKNSAGLVRKAMTMGLIK